MYTLSTRLLSRSIHRFCLSRPLVTISHELSDDASGIAAANQKLSHVALVGTPNAGKSTLLNRLVDARLAAVSRKENTTRRLVRGVLTRGDTQLLLWDTPGLVHANTKSNLGPARKDIASTGWRASLSADSTVVVLDACRNQAHHVAVCNIMQQLLAYERQPHHRLFLCINKSDRVKPRQKLLDSVAFFVDHLGDKIEPPFVTSGITGRGVDALRDSLLAVAQPETFQYEPGTLTEDQHVDIIEQHVWEKILHRLHQEIPYRCILEIEETRNHTLRGMHVSFVIRVPRSTLVPMVVGHRGEIVRWIADKAAYSASEVLGLAVTIKIRVAVYSASTMYTGGFAAQINT